MEREPRLPRLSHQKGRERKRLKAQGTPLKTISISSSHSTISNVTHGPPHAHSKTFIQPCLSADVSAFELFTSGNAGTI